jgi:hypothetical protein
MTLLLFSCTSEDCGKLPEDFHAKSSGSLCTIFHETNYPPEDWKIGRLEDWKIGRLEDWKIGRLEDFALRVVCLMMQPVPFLF